MTPAEFAASHDHADATPSLLCDVWGHGDAGREDWCQALVEQLADASVEFQMQQETHSELLCGSFEEFLDLCFESTHNRAFFLFDENLMEQRADLRSQLRLPVEYFGEDLFARFPPKVQPKDACLIVGGEGARSTLHSDPFDWVGTNYCLEGSKLWTFIAPDPLCDGDGDRRIARALEGYRVEPNAWEGEEENAGGNQQRPQIAAGWQSDRNIYACLSPAFLRTLPQTREKKNVCAAIYHDVLGRTRAGTHTIPPRILAHAHRKVAV